MNERRSPGSTTKQPGKDNERGPNSQAPSSLIEIDGVYKQYGTGVMAVSDMSLRIEQGQFVSFLGPSGCGKSTALRMIAGLESISAGNIRINGHAPGKGLSARRISVSYFRSRR